MHSQCLLYSVIIPNRHDFRLPTSLLISRSLCDLLAAGFARVDVEDTASSNLDVIQNALAGDRDVHGEPVSLTADIKPYGRST